MKVLITGATGFLGSHLCRRFAQEDYEVTVFRRPGSSTTLIEDLKVRHAIGDITDLEDVKRAIRGQEWVIHAAAHGAYWRHYRDVQTRVNVEGTQNVVAACKKHDIKRLLHVSSVVTIGVTTEPSKPANESFHFNLGNTGLIYPITKRQAEEYVLQASHSDLDALVVNPASIFGPFGNRYRGAEMIEDVRHRPIALYFLGGRNVVHVDDVVEGILGALKRGRSGQRYILGGENISYRQIAVVAAQCLELRRAFMPVYPIVTRLASLILESMGKYTGKRPRITYDVHYFASRYLYYDSIKAVTELGFCARPFREMVMEYIVTKGLLRPRSTHK